MLAVLPAASVGDFVHGHPTKISAQAIQVLREAEKIAVIWDFVSVRNATFPVASVMNFAEAFTPRRTLSSMLQENR